MSFRAAVLVFTLIASSAAANGAETENDQVIADTTEALRKVPNDPIAYQRRGVARYYKRDYDGALADLDQAVRLEPENAEMRCDRGDVWDIKREYKKAIADYTQAIRLAPADPRGHYQRGNAWLSRDNLDRALADFNEAIRLAPEDAAAYRHRANYWEATQQDDKAIADYRKSIALDPQSVLAFYALGNLYERKGDLQQAISNYSAAYAVVDKHAMFARAILLSRAGLYDKLGQYDLAIADYTAMFALDPQRGGMALRQRAKTWFAKGNYDRALADYDLILRKEGPARGTFFELPALIGRAEVWIAKGDYDKAIADYEEVARLVPKLRWNAWDKLAKLLISCPSAKYRDGSKAVGYATEACKLTDWKRPDLLSTLASAYAEAGQFDDAIQWQQKAIDLDLAVDKRQPTRATNAPDDVKRSKKVRAMDQARAEFRKIREQRLAEMRAHLELFRQHKTLWPPPK